MSDEKTILLEQAERIAKLEEQTRDLQLQLKRMQGRLGKRKNRKHGLLQSFSLFNDVWREILGRLAIALGGFVLFSLYVGIRLESLDPVPGGAAVWVPVWWAALFLTCAIVVILFVTADSA